MGRGRNKALTKRIVREMKYNPPKVDFEELENQLHDQLINPDLAANNKQNAWYVEPEEEKPISEKLDEEEIDEYLEWAKQAAEKAEAKPSPARQTPKATPKK